MAQTSATGACAAFKGETVGVERLLELRRLRLRGGAATPVKIADAALNVDRAKAEAATLLQSGLQVRRCDRRQPSKWACRVPDQKR